jgi:hypothetical protein
MPKWNEVNLAYLEVETGRRSSEIWSGWRTLEVSTLPRGVCQWGYNPKYKSIQVSICDPAFIEWYRSLEQRLCSETPFRSNLKDGQMRLKADDATLFFGPDGTVLRTAQNA